MVVAGVVGSGGGGERVVCVCVGGGGGQRSSSWERWYSVDEECPGGTGCTGVRFFWQQTVINSNDVASPSMLCAVA